MKKRFLFVLPSLDSGGAERNIVSLASHISQWDTVDLAVIRMKGELLDKIPANVQIHDLGSPLKVFYKLPLLVKKLQPFAVLSTIWDLNFIIAILKPFFPANTRLVFREAILPNAHFSEKYYRYPFHIIYGRLYRRAHAVVALSKEMRSVLITKYLLDAEKVHVIYNAVSNDRISDLKSGITMDSGAGCINILSIGRLEHQKGFDNLIKAFYLVSKECSCLQLMIVGNGSERKTLENLIKLLGVEDRVRLLGQRANPFATVNNLTIYAMTSHYEGMSNALIEALVLGVPVLATTRNCSAAEIIIDGVNGCLIETSTVATIANGLRRAIHCHASLSRPDISEMAGNKFGMEQYLSEYWDVLCGSINNFTIPHPNFPVVDKNSSTQ